MSLTRSLLALAILAVASAQNGCVVKYFGQITANPVPLQEVYVPPPSGQVIIPTEYCINAGFNGPAVGERVEACNAVDLNGPPPNLSAIDLRTLQVDSPSGANVKTTLYCP